MFNPYDADNHAGMLSSMKPDSLLGLSGPTRGEPSNTVAPAKNPAVAKLLEDAAAALVLRRKAIIANAEAQSFASEEKAKAAQVEAFKTEIGHFRTQYLAASEAMTYGLEQTIKNVMLSLLTTQKEVGYPHYKAGDSYWDWRNIQVATVPWLMRNAFYGYDAIDYGAAPGKGLKVQKGNIPQNLKFRAKHSGPLPQGIELYSGNTIGLSKYKGGFALPPAYKDGRAPLKALSADVATAPPSSLGLVAKGGKGDSWVQVEDGIAYVVHPDGWRFASRDPKEYTKLRYFGKWTDENPQYGGGVAQKYWNELVIPPAMNQQAIYLKLVEAQQNLQKAEFGLRSAQQNAKAKAAEFGTLEGQFQQAMQTVDALKVKLPKDSQEYAAKALTALQAAVELDAFTEAREMLLKKNSELASLYNPLISQAEALIAEAEAESDPLKKQRKQAEAQRRLTRAKEYADRGQSLRNRSGDYGTRRTTAVPVARGAAGLVPSRAVLPTEVAAAVSGVKPNADKIGGLSKTQIEQQAAADQAQKKMSELAEKLPEGYKPPNIPPPQKEEEAGGGFGLIVAGLVAYAALRK